MRTFFLLLLLSTAALTACGNDFEVTEATYEHKLTWTQTPGEIQDCHVFKLGNARHIEVDRLQVKFPEGSHHVHLYRSNESEPDKVFDCFRGIDWTRWSLVVGAQTREMDWQLPEGVTLPLEPHQQLLAQVHWLNASDETVKPEIDLAFHTSDSSEQHLGVVFGVNQRIDIQPGQQVRVEQFCQMPQGAQVHALMGHFHQHGSDYRVTERMQNETTGKLIYQAKDEPTFEFQRYSPALDVRPGAGFEFGCGFFNGSGQPITWGSDTKTQEHCNMTAYYAPAPDAAPTLCLLEPSKLAALTPHAQTVNAGEEVAFAIELAKAETENVSVMLRSSDATVIEIPAVVELPAGQTRVVFNARALRPASVDLSASLAGATVSTQLRVKGLVISEVFYQAATGNSNGLQWVELENRTDIAIDLSRYSIGAGNSDFMRTRMPLPMSIPPHGCIVVGGPESSAANFNPVFDLLEDLSPDLGTGGTLADGIGLFGMAAQGILPDTRPLDAVVYAGSSTQLRGPDGQIAPVWPGANPGGSLRRVTDTVWAKSEHPTPGVCEVVNAQ